VATPEEIRAAEITKEIYARHGIPEGTDPTVAAEMIGSMAEGAWGAQPSAWANPEERAAAREQYALGGSSPQEVQDRWEKSIYLVDPETHRYQQNFARDQQFLDRVGVGDEQDPAVTAWTGPANPERLRQARAGEAVAAWNQTENNPLYRDNWFSSGWALQDSPIAGVGGAITNPDTALGAGMTFMNIPFDFLAMHGSNESKTANDSWRTAAGLYKTAMNNRLNSPAPILDLPSGATVQERAARLKELQQQAATGAVPSSAERWKRTSGFVPPPFIRDAGDAFLATLDGTQLIPGVAFGKAAAKGAATAAAKGAAKDMAFDAATSTAITAGLAQKPERTWGQYLGLAPEAPEDLAIKSDEEVAAANDARRQMFDRSLQQYGSGVSTYDDEAYKRLQKAGRVPIRNQ
jgi:hypothetical protein